MRMRIVAMTFGFGTAFAMAACGAPESRPVQDPVDDDGDDDVRHVGERRLDACRGAVHRHLRHHAPGDAEEARGRGHAAGHRRRARRGRDQHAGAAERHDPEPRARDRGAGRQRSRRRRSDEDADNTRSTTAIATARSPRWTRATAAEIAITAAIRERGGDKSLSFTAKNVKIITVGGKVTLRGPVKSDEEKSAIEAKAQGSAGRHRRRQPARSEEVKRELPGLVRRSKTRIRKRERHEKSRHVHRSEPGPGRGRSSRQLQAAGFSHNDISVLFPDKHGTKDFAHEHNTKAPEGAVAGAGTGGVARRHARPPRRHRRARHPRPRPVHRGRPAPGGAQRRRGRRGVGGVTGALVGMGIPEIEAKRYEGKIKGGNLLVSVHTESPTRRSARRTSSRRRGPTTSRRAAESSVPSRDSRAHA